MRIDTVKRRGKTDVTSVSPLLYCNRLSSSNPSTIFMLTFTDILLIGQQFGLCFECFLYGKISVLCALTCTITVTIAKEVQLLHGPGVYSPYIFAMPKERFQDSNDRLLCSLSSLCSIYSYRGLCFAIYHICNIF